MVLCLTTTKKDDLNILSRLADANKCKICFESHYISTLTVSF